MKLSKHAAHTLRLITPANEDERFALTCALEAAAQAMFNANMARRHSANKPASESLASMAASGVNAFSNWINRNIKRS